MIHSTGSPGRAAFFLLLTLIWLPIQARTESVVATLGDSQITRLDLEAAIAGAPPAQRRGILTDRSRIEQILEVISLRRATLEHAQLDQHLSTDQIAQIRRDTELTALGTLYLSQQLADLPAPDLDALSLASYTENQATYVAPETVSVTHILIGNEDRTDQEALALATELRAQLAEDPTLFAAFVAEHSDDPVKGRNKGKYPRFPRGKMVPPFEQWAFNTTESGQISPPVKTRFGYHLIRFDSREAERPLEYTEVSERLKVQAKQNYYVLAREKILDQNDDSFVALGLEAREENFEQDVLSRRSTTLDVEERLLKAYRTAFLAQEVGADEAIEKLAYEQYQVTKATLHRDEWVMLQIIRETSLPRDEVETLVDNCARAEIRALATDSIETKLIDTAVTSLDEQLTEVVDSLRQSTCRFRLIDGPEGFAVVELLNLTPPGIPSFDQVKKQLIAPLLATRQDQAWNQHLSYFRNLPAHLDEDALQAALSYLTEKYQ